MPGLTKKMFEDLRDSSEYPDLGRAQIEHFKEVLFEVFLQACEAELKGRRKPPSSIDAKIAPILVSDPRAPKNGIIDTPFGQLPCR